MLDIKVLRNEPEKVERALLKRKENFDLSGLFALDDERKALIYEVEQKKNKQNIVSKQIPALKKEGKDVAPIFEEMKKLSDEIKEYDAKVRELDEKINDILLTIPNIPNETVPQGDTDEDNVEMRKFMEPSQFDFEPKAHWDIGENLNILDFETAGKTTGARFTFYKGLGARLERSIINFFLNTHTEESGYTEVFPPYMVHRRSMVGTGQLPKFEEDAFKVSGTDYFLIPTAEVPVTNMYREQILDGNQLPIKHVAYSACFRSEAGSAGRDTRGLIRQHQFNKVELVKFAKPEESYEELEKLTRDAEKVLQLLKLPYRVRNTGVKHRNNNISVVCYEGDFVTENNIIFGQIHCYVITKFRKRCIFIHTICYGINSNLMPYRIDRFNFSDNAIFPKVFDVYPLITVCAFT